MSIRFTYDEARKELLSTLKRLSGRHSISKVFRDFMEMSTIAISNRFDKAQFSSREERYLKIASQYTKDETEHFAYALAVLVAGLTAATNTGYLHDMLGELYMELGLNDRCKAQVFTPIHLASLLAMLTQTNDPDNPGKPALVYDPTAGSGVLVIGYANALISKHLNYFTNMVAETVDIDPVCVHMCYIQLSMYGIPAIAKHGNTITAETFSIWHTPMYILQGYISKDDI